VRVFPRDHSLPHFGQAASWAKSEDAGVSCRQLLNRSAPPLESRCIHLPRSLIRDRLLKGAEGLGSNPLLVGGGSCHHLLLIIFLEAGNPFQDGCRRIELLVWNSRRPIGRTRRRRLGLRIRLGKGSLRNGEKPRRRREPQRRDSARVSSLSPLRDAPLG
jgi:hypothetical protein